METLFELIPEEDCDGTASPVVIGNEGVLDLRPASRKILGEILNDWTAFINSKFSLTFEFFFVGKSDSAILEESDLFSWGLISI